MAEVAVPVLFTLPNGLEVLLHPLEQLDFDMLCVWMKQSYLNDVTNAIADMDKTARLKFIKEALDTAARDDFFSTRGQAVLFGTTAGLARVGYQMIVDKDAITFDDFYRLLFPGQAFMIGGPASIRAGYHMLNKMISAVYGEDKIPVPSQNEVVEGE